MRAAKLKDRCYQATLLGALLLLLAGCEGGGDGQQTPQLDLSQRTTQAPRAEAPRPASDPAVLRFGFDPRASLEEDARQYLPFLAYLEQTTGLRFKLHFSSNRPIAEELAGGEVAFAAIGATSYILAREHHPITPLVRGLNSQGEAAYRAMIVVRPDSTLTTVAQLRGKRFAFGNVDSTQGHLIPRILLNQAGLDLSDLASYDYTGSHRNCADAVVSGKADACGMQDALASRLVGEGLVRILHSSDYYPSSGIAAAADLPPKVVEKVRDALLSFDPQGRHAAGLYHWERTEMPRGFTRANPDDYLELRRWMIRFGMLEAGTEGEPGTR